jgi:hypothetical protein
VSNFNVKKLGKSLIMGTAGTIVKKLTLTYSI